MHDPFVYFFANGHADGGNEHKEFVGGKGASLAEMTRAGLRVPPGFTISALCCERYLESPVDQRRWPPGLEEAVRASLQRLEALVGRKLGQGGNPLLVAVRSGAAQSMPGMMDTVLNVGLNPDCVPALALRTGNPRGAWESYRHFLALFAPTVMGVPELVLTNAALEYLFSLGKTREDELDGAGMQSLCSALRTAIEQHAGKPVPADPWDSLRQAIDAVFNSWNSERAIAYRQRHHVESRGTAVNVQVMCPSEVSGVLFTAHPVSRRRDQLLLESSFGLGEAIVLGKVEPDRFLVDRDKLTILESVIAEKKHIVATLASDGRARELASDTASLTPGQVIEVAKLGLRIEAYFGTPCDIEWGLSGGEFYLLQSRPIKGIDNTSLPLASARDEAETELVRQEEIAALKLLAAPEGTVWARFNLSEILPEPTPMTWGIVREYMSGRGGFGLVYRDLGLDPDPALDEVGIYDLVCGRPYCNLSREPRLRYHRIPFEHSFAKLKADPGKAIYPQPVLNPVRAGFTFWLTLPVIVWNLAAAEGKLRRLSQTFPEDFKKRLLPAYLEEVRRAGAEDLTLLKPEVLAERLTYWRQRTLTDFAREALKPTIFAALAQTNLERALGNALKSRAGSKGTQSMEEAQAVLRELTMGFHPEPDADLPAALQALTAGKMDRAAFLRQFGHRGPNEMELAEPRWSEDFRGLQSFSPPPGTPGRGVGGEGDSVRPPPHPQPLSPGVPGARGAEALSAAQRQALQAELERLRVFVGLREAGKHYLLMGYALIRRILLELDRRFELQGGIFFLTPEEIPELLRTPSAPAELKDRIAKRKRRREVALSLPMPQVLFSDDLEAIGRALDNLTGNDLQGTPLSAGVAEGLALVLERPTTDNLPSEPFILVCPTTDPAWVPLFMHARGLVMETGGVLSHGAIVAREFGLPAVAGLPDVHRRIRNGQRLRVNGATGRVNILD